METSTEIMVERADKKRRTRELILDTAVGYIAEKGFLSFDTAGIARAASLSHGVLFSHFPRREDLMVAAIRLVCEKMVEAMHDQVRPDSGPQPVLSAQLRILSENESFFCHLVAQSRYLPPDARHCWTLLVSAASHHLLESLPPGKDQRSASTLWWALIEHYCLHADQFSPGKSVLKQRSREIIALWSESCGFVTEGENQ